MITLQDVFQAYYDCRKDKRQTKNALEYELDYEFNLMQLYSKIINKTYIVWPSIVFVVDKPVKREIFAWSFEDRIVHHLIINKINYLFEKEFIYDSYSCRVWKWTSFWIKRVLNFFKKASNNYTKETYVLKLDISWFFQNIDKNILYLKIVDFLNTKYSQDDLDIILYLIKQVIFNDCTKNCILKWNKHDWVWLPKNKSLFFTWNNIWLPIWNLTSQIFWNFYLNSLDHYIKSTLNIKYYGRYVDDMIFLDNDKQKLQNLISKVEKFLNNNLNLKLNHKKTYLNPINKWVLFLWAYILPYRVYIWNRTKNNFYQKILNINKMPREEGFDKKIDICLSSINSYLWIIKNYNTYLLRKKILFKLHAKLFNYFYISSWYKIIKKKHKYL